jgi:hypothetical protein
VNRPILRATFSFNGESHPVMTRQPDDIDNAALRAESTAWQGYPLAATPIVHTG